MYGQLPINSHEKMNQETVQKSENRQEQIDLLEQIKLNHKAQTEVLPQEVKVNTMY